MKKKKLAELESRFSPLEAAERAGCSYRTIMNHVHAGNLRAVRRKGSRLYEILERDHVAWMDGEPVPGTDQKGG
jgi:excisionase family DNA binding protein